MTASINLRLGPLATRDDAYHGGELHWLNAMKMVCALMVVMIHAHFFWRRELMPLCRLAVPFFLMVSGFFLPGRDGAIERERVERVFGHIFVLTVGLQVFYFVFRLVMHYVGWGNGFPAFGLSPKFIFLTIFEGDLYAPQTWYLNSYLLALGVIWLLLRWRCEGLIYWIAVPALVVNLLVGSYYNGAFGDMPGYALRNFMLTSLPFVAVGVWIRRHAWLLPRWRVALTMFLISVPFMLAEGYWLGDEVGDSTGDIYLLTPVAGALFFVAALTAPDRSAPRWLSWMGRELSAGVFYFHYLFVRIFIIVVPTGGWSFIVISACAIAAALLFRLIERTLKKKPNQ